jgi:hypothetical protein
LAWGWLIVYQIKNNMKLTTEQQNAASDLIKQHLGAKDAVYNWFDNCNFCECSFLVGLSFADLNQLNSDLLKNGLYLSCIFSVAGSFMTYRMTINESGVIY